MGASTVLGRKRLEDGTDSPAEQRPEVVETARGHARSVNATPFARKGTAVTTGRLSGRGTLRRVDAIEEGSAPVRPDRYRARNVANPMAVCRVQQTCGVPTVFGPAAEETVEVGRNDEDGRRSGVATRAPGELRLARMRTRRHGERRRGSDEPHERSPRRGGREIARRGPHEPESVSEEEIASHAPRGARGGTSEGRTSPSPPRVDSMTRRRRESSPASPRSTSGRPFGSRDDPRVGLRSGAQFAA